MSDLQQRLESYLLRQNGLGQDSGSEIPRLEGNGPYPASFSQARLWFLDELYGNDPLYNESKLVRLNGPLDIDALENAYAALIARHEVLRTTFSDGEEGPLQIVQPAGSFSMLQTDLSGLKAAERESAWRTAAVHTARKPFNLKEDLMIRVHLLRFSEDEYLLLQVIHHIATDGLSMRIITREIRALYEAFLAGKPSPLPALPIQFKDYAVWQRAKYEEPAQAANLAYWEAHLQGLKPLDLHGDYARPLKPDHAGMVLTFLLPDEQLESVRSAARREGVTLHMFLFAVFAVLLHRYSGQDDIPIGTPVANRTVLETEALIGFFVNTLVMRADLSGNPSFRDLLLRVREMTLDALDHQSAPFEQVIGALQPERHLNRNPLFQVLFQVIESNYVSTYSMAEVGVESIFIETGIAKFDLELTLNPVREGLSGRWRFSKELFNESTMERMIAHFMRLISEATAHPQRSIGALGMIGSAEREQLVTAWNDTQTRFAEEPALHQMVEKTARERPRDTAVRFRGEDISYRALNSQANKLARHLSGLGVRPGMAVALSLPRSPQMLITLLAILKAGAAYVPIDPAYPADRMQFMLADSGAAHLVTCSDLAAAIPRFAGTTLFLDRSDHWLGEMDGDLNLALLPRQIAYLIYTSGSTGQPKGVTMSHDAIGNLLQWQAGDARLGQPARTVQFTPLSFDVSCQEIFSTWQRGGTLVLTDEETRRSPTELLSFLDNEAIERIFLPYVALELLAGEARRRGRAPGALRDIVSAGEQLVLTEDIRHLLDLLPACRLHNHYGPTETHVVTALTLPADTAVWPAVAPIGRPIANTEIQLRDQYGNLAPIGAPGELMVSGAMLAEGYWRQPELSAERFISDAHNSGKRVYRTGDLARWLPNGSLQFLGRNDEQIKIRGYRVEPGEIEAVLRRHEGLREVVVVARGEGHDKQLAAYLVAEADAFADEEAVAAHMRRQLPVYMLPAYYVFLDDLPYTPSGKIDRRALPEPVSKAGGDDQPPRSEEEEMLLNIWREVLQIDTVGVFDSFFALGGHSLLGIKLFNRIEDVMGMDLPLSILFQTPTIADIALLISESREKEDGHTKALLNETET